MPDRPQIRRPRRPDLPGRPVVVPGVFVSETPRPRTITGADTSTTAFVGRFDSGPVGVPQRVLSAHEAAAAFGEGTHASRAVQLFFANGGSKAWVVRVADEPGPGALVDGLVALDGVDEFAQLCVPDTALLGPTESAMAAAAAVTYAADRRVFYVMDPPVAASAADTIAWLEHHPTLRSPNAAAYVPGVLVAGDSEAVSASGAVAGIYARTDVERGVWKAPAGDDAAVVGIEGLAHSFDDSAIEALVAAGINPLVDARGLRVWGARTTAGDTEWKFVSVRRYFMFLERSIERGTAWAVFEPNAEPLWAQLRATVADFLSGLWRHGAFQGAKPEDAFFVRCDRTTTTPDDVDAGIVNIVVGFAPLKPAEFVIFRIGQKTLSTDG